MFGDQRKHQSQRQVATPLAYICTCQIQQYNSIQLYLVMFDCYSVGGHSVEKPLSVFQCHLIIIRRGPNIEMK